MRFRLEGFQAVFEFGLNRFVESQIGSESGWINALNLCWDSLNTMKWLD